MKRNDSWVAQLIIIVLLALPVGAATVTLSKQVRQKTPESLGIPKGGVAPHGIKAFVVQPAAAKAKANSVFQKNPVAAKVRSQAEEESEDDRALKFKRGPVHFEISKAAGAEILLDLERYAVGEKPKHAVDKSMLERTARKYIVTQMPDVKQGEIKFVGVKKIMDSVAKVSDDGQVSDAKSSVANYILIFRRRVNNVPVVGPGGQVRVYLSSSGEVIGHSKIWRSLDKASGPRRPIVPPGQVQRAVTKALANHPAPKVEIDYFEFGYLAEGRYSKQAVMNPVYVVGYKGSSEEKRVIRLYDAYTGAEITPPADPPGADTKK